MKKILAFLLAFITCAGVLAPVAGAGFGDVHDPAVQTAVTLLQNIGIVAGYGDGTFRPDNNLTRAQFCKMAVLLSGTKDVAIYEGFTVFPDVRANHWSRGYVNAAVRSLKIITGFPDGTFKPDTPINYAQAVTTLMRLLGYTDADVGLVWPRGYLEKAADIGLTKGISLKDSEMINRGLAARMFYNAIFINSKDGKKFSEILGFAEQKVIILQADATGQDGVTKGFSTIGGSGFYPYRSALDAAELTQGTLLIDKDGYALDWTPDKQTRIEVTVKETGPMSITGQNGNKIDNIPADATVYINGEMVEWSKCWIDITPGQALSIFFNATGTIDYMFLYKPSDDGVVKIIAAEPEKGRNPLPSLGIEAGTRVFKNGVATTWAYLRANDVLTYSAASRTVNATDFRITGIYENAIPSREAPDEVTTLGGKSYKVLPAARSKLADATIGDALTFLFTVDGRVADVQPATKPTYQPGILAADGSVVLYNGTVLSGENPWKNGPKEGSPAMACITERGKLNLQAIPPKDADELDIGSMKAGEADIAPYAVFMDLCGVEGRATLVDISSMPSTVDAKSVQTISFDSSGRANLIVMRNVTGDSWMYGFATLIQGEIDSIPIYDDDGNMVGSLPYQLPNDIVITNQNGRYVFSDSRNYCANVNDSNIFALAVSTYGMPLACKPCVRVNNVKRYDFTGNNAVTVSGVPCPIKEGTMVYVEATKRYISIAEARAYSNNFSIYLDKPAPEGGRPRFIIAR